MWTIAITSGNLYPLAKQLNLGRAIRWAEAIHSTKNAQFVLTVRLDNRLLPDRLNGQVPLPAEEPMNLSYATRNRIAKPRRAEFLCSESGMRFRRASNRNLIAWLVRQSELILFCLLADSIYR